MFRTSKIVVRSLFFGLVLTVTACRELKQYLPPSQPIESVRIALAVPEDESWESTIFRATIFIYPHDQTSPGTAPVVKYIFSRNDIEHGRALIPMSPDFLVGQQVDIYAVVNSRDTNIYKNNKPYSRGELLRLLDSSAVSRYNHSSYAQLSDAIITSGGFMMSGATTTTIERDGMQPIAIQLTRTVARVDLSVTTDMEAFRRYVTGIGQPDATLQINSAWMLRTNRRVPIFDNQTEFVDDYRPPYNRKDSLVQDNDVLLPQPYVGQFRFYMFATAQRGAINYPFTDDQSNEAIKIAIRAIYDPDGNASTANSRAIYYAVPFQAGANSQWAAAVVRNTQFEVNIVVAGIAGAISMGETSKADGRINYVVGSQ